MPSVWNENKELRNNGGYRMSQVKRIYVEKKPDYAVAAQELLENIHSYLGISGVFGVRVLIRYDIENISDETYETAKVTIFSEPPVDLLYEEELPADHEAYVFSVEALPGQFDQRADSALGNRPGAAGP